MANVNFTLYHGMSIIVTNELATLIIASAHNSFTDTFFSLHLAVLWFQWNPLEKAQIISKLISVFTRLENASDIITKRKVGDNCLLSLRIVVLLPS